MSGKYSKADIRHIAESMIEDLRECEDGTITSTSRLAYKFGYMDLETEDLYELHDAIFRVAKANKIKLDMSEHDGKVEGLPFNLTFVVKNKKAQIKCPRCGSIDTARYIYGYPAFSEEMEKKLKEGKWALGGCCMNGVEINGQYVETMPTRCCNNCKKDFGSAPILITRKTGMAEDYRDIVKSIKFSVGGYFGGYTVVTISQNSEGANVNVQKFPDGLDIPENKQITKSKWNKIVNTLYSQLYLNEWKKRFVDPQVMDGTQWSLDINLSNRRARHYYGSNDYPPYWPELKKIFGEFAKL